MKICGCPLPGLSTGLLISAITVLLISFLYALYEALGLVYLFTFDLLSWFSLVTGMISVMAAILALVGRSKEDIQSLTWSFIVATISLGCATIMTSFLLIFQAQASTSKETRFLSILRIFSMYFFNVLLPLSWMAYEVREFTVFLIHETDSQYTLRRKYIVEMDREVREVLPTTRKRKSKLSSWDKEDISENEKKSMMEMGRGKERRRKRRSGRSHRNHSRDASA